MKNNQQSPHQVRETVVPEAVPMALPPAGMAPTINEAHKFSSQSEYSSNHSRPQAHHMARKAVVEPFHRDQQSFILTEQQIQQGLLKTSSVPQPDVEDAADKQSLDGQAQRLQKLDDAALGQASNCQVQTVDSGSQSKVRHTNSSHDQQTTQSKTNQDKAASSPNQDAQNSSDFANNQAHHHSFRPGSQDASSNPQKSHESFQQIEQIDQPIEQKLNEEHDQEFCAPTTRPYQSSQGPNTAGIYNMGGRSSNFGTKTFVPGGQEGASRKRDRVSKESRQSRKSRQQSKESESRSRCNRSKSSSLQRFQSQIPKKEFRDETGIITEAEERAPYHLAAKTQKIKPPQNALSHLPPREENESPSPARHMFSQGRKYNDHSALLLHNKNLSGLHAILDSLKSLTEPLEALMKLNHHLMRGQEPTVPAEAGAETNGPDTKGSIHGAQQTLVNPKDYEKELGKLYQEALRKQQLQKQQSAEKASDLRSSLQVQQPRPETSAVAAAGPNPQFVPAGSQDQQRVVHSRIIQQILRQLPTLGNEKLAGHDGALPGGAYNQQWPRTTLQASSSYALYSGKQYARVADTDHKDLQSRRLQEEAESKAKDALAGGFQLQDSVKISSQKRQDHDEDMDRDEEMLAVPNDMIADSIMRQEHPARPTGNGHEQLQRFMNDMGGTPRFYNIGPSQFPIGKSGVINDTDSQNAAAKIVQTELMSISQQLAPGSGQMLLGALNAQLGRYGIKSGQNATRDLLQRHQTQFDQKIKSSMQKVSQRGQNNQQYIQSLNMQTLDTPATKVDNDQIQRIESLDKHGQRLFQQQSEKRTNSATGEHESASRQQDGPDPLAAARREEERRMADARLAHQFDPVDSGRKEFETQFEEPVAAAHDDAMVKDNLQSLHDEALQKANAGATSNQPLPLPDQLRLQQALSAGVGSQNDGLQKIIQMLPTLPTELFSSTAAQDRKQLLPKSANDTNEGRVATSATFNQQQHPSKPLSGSRVQNVGEVASNLKFLLTQTQNVTQIAAEQKGQREVPEPAPTQDQGTSNPDPAQGEQTNHGLIKHLILKSKELTGLAHMLGITDVEAQLQNLISDLKETSGNVSSSGLGCGSLNSVNGVQSRASGDSAGSGTESGQKDREAMAGKDSKLGEDKSNGLKESGCSGVSGGDNEVGDLAASGNNLVNQKPREDDKGSGSAVASKAHTNGSNTLKNGNSTDKESRSNGIDIAKLQELIENYLPDPNIKQGNYVATNQDNNGNSLLGNVSNILQSKVQNGDSKAALLGSQQNPLQGNRAGNNVDGGHGSGDVAMRYNGPTSSSEEGNKKGNSRNGQLTSSQSQSFGVHHQNQLAEQEHAYLTSQLKNQEQEISKLKTFILLNLFNGPSSLGSDERAKLTQQLLQDFMKQVLTASTGTHTGTVATDNTNMNQQDFSTHEPAAMPAQPMQPSLNMDTQAQTSNTIALLQQQKSPATLSQAGLLVQQRLGLAQQSSNLSSLLGKRSAFQRQAGEKGPVPTKSIEQKDERTLSNINNDLDERQRLLKSRLGMMMGSLSQLQAPNASFLPNAQGGSTQLYSRPQKNQPPTDPKQALLIRHEPSTASVGRHAISAAKAHEHQGKNALISNILRYKQMNSGERQSDLCATLHQQGFHESAEHKYEGTSAFIRLKAQIKKNMNVAQFLQQKAEIMNAVSKSAPDALLIGEKPKRPHHNMGEDTFRGSKFRGVSKNKCKWQMMIMINQKKVYIGAIHSEMEAAKYYDHIAILTQGLNSKTNFAYTAAQLEKIVRDYDFSNESNFYGDYNSQMTSAYNSKQNTKQNLQEAQLDDYSLSNRQLSKRQRREDGANIQESSDENAMIGNHVYNDRAPPQVDNLAATGCEPQLTGGQLEKLQQLGASLPSLLNFQKQKMLLQNGNQLQDRSRALAAAQMKLAGLSQMDAQPAQAIDMNGLQRLNVQPNAGPSAQLLQQLLGATGNFQPTQSPNVLQLDPRLAMAKQGTQEQDIHTLQELRQYLDQNRKNGNQATELILSQKPSPATEREPVRLQGAPQIGPQQALNKISADSWKNIQNHARFQPVPNRQPNKITTLGAAIGPTGHQMTANDAQETIDESLQNVEMLKDKVQQQLLLFGNGSVDMLQRATQQVPTERKDIQQFAALRPPASSVVAAAHDPYRTPPRQRADYGHDQ